MTRPKADVSKSRLNLELHPDLLLKVQEIRERTGAASVSEVIRRSIEMHAWVTKLPDRGETLMVRDSEGKMREITFL